MDKLPQRIKRTVERLRKERGAYIEVISRGERYYAYESTSRWDKERKRARKVMTYIGRITPAGELIEAKRREKSFMESIGRMLPPDARHDFERIRNAHPDARIGRIEEDKLHIYGTEQGREKLLGVLSSKGLVYGYEEMEREKEALKLKDDEEKILTCLSMNARMPVSQIAKIAGIDMNTAYSKTKALEKKLGIRYISEIDVGKLGYEPYIVLIKFDDRMPSVDELREFVTAEPKIQFAAMTKGAYDLIIYLLEENTSKAGYKVWHMRDTAPINRYKATWYISPSAWDHGYMPLRDEFFEKVISGNEWKRSRERPEPGKEELLHRELAVLKELNSNGNIDFSRIDTLYNLGRGAAQYTYHKLKDDGIIIRTTITMESLPIKYIGLIILELESVEEYSTTRAALLTEVIAHKEYLDKYSLVMDIGTPNGVMVFTPIMRDEEMGRTIDYFRDNIKGVKIDDLIATQVLVGSLCYRRFDKTYSVQYDRLVNTYKIAEAKERIVYD